MSDIAVTATAQQLEEMLYIGRADDGPVIECNSCSADDFLFWDGDTGTRAGWLGRAVAHYAKHHPEYFKG